MMASITFRFRCDFLMASGRVQKNCVFAGYSKDLRSEAREESTSGGALKQYVVASR
jgi:hypothetical protein